MAPSMVAPSWPDLWPSTGAQQHEIVRPDDSFFLTRITAPAHPPQHYTCAPCPSSARAPLHAHDGLQSMKHRGFAGEGTRRVHLLDLAKYILRNIPQFLILRLLAAEAARLFLLPALSRRCLGAADYLLTSGSRVARQRGAQAGGLASGQAPCTHRIHRRNAKAANLTRRSRGKAAPAPRQTRIGGLSQGRQTPC